MQRIAKKRDHVDIAVNNLLLFKEVVHVTNFFKASKIDYILLKGPSMVKLYGDIGLRETADIDILVKKKDVVRTEKILFSLGYRYDSEMHSKFHQSLLGYHYQYKKDNYLIEVHYDLFPPLAPITKSLLDPWDYKEKIRLFGSKITVLQGDFLFLYICISFMFPNFFKDSKKFLTDIKLLAKNRDFGRIYRMVRDSKSYLYVYYTCYYSNKLVNARIPNRFLKNLEKNLSSTELYLVNIFDGRYLKKAKSVSYTKKLFLYMLFNLVWRTRINPSNKF